jgi:hypothetical protein
MDRGTIASFRVQFKNKLLKRVLIHFDSFTARQDLRNIVPNVKACYYVVLSSVERDEPPNHMKQLEDVQDFTSRVECRFCHG